MFNNRNAFLGQVPLVLGPSSWGYGMNLPAPTVLPAYNPAGTPPYFGEWGVVGEGGEIIDSGSVGPFDTIDEAFSAAADAAHAAGAELLPRDGFAEVKNSTGRTVKIT